MSLEVLLGRSITLTLGIFLHICYVTWTTSSQRVIPYVIRRRVVLNVPISLARLESSLTPLQELCGL